MKPHRVLRAGVGLALALTAAVAAAPAAATAATAARARLQGRIAFTANLTGKPDAWQLYTMRPDGTHVHQVTHFAHSMDTGMFPSFAPDGGRLTFSSSVSGNADIYVIGSDGSGQRQLTRDSADELAPAWSPDGQHIAFARTASTGNNTIWTMNVNGSSQRRLTSPSYDSFLPTYTPDGKHILFESSKGGLVAAVWIMRVDGTHLRRLTRARLEGTPLDVSPDGRHVLVGDHQNTALPTSIWVMNIDGSRLHRLTNAGCCFHDGNARYSPDGRTIALVTDRWYAPRGIRENEIWEMNADGTNLHVVTSSITRGGCPDDLVGNCNGPISWHR